MCTSVCREVSSLFLVVELDLGSSALVAEELGVDRLDGAVALTLGLPDAVLVSLLVLVVGRVVLRLCHL